MHSFHQIEGLSTQYSVSTLTCDNVLLKKGHFKGVKGSVSAAALIKCQSLLAKRNHPYRANPRNVSVCIVSTVANNLISSAQLIKPNFPLGEMFTKLTFGFVSFFFSVKDASVRHFGLLTSVIQLVLEL